MITWPVSDVAASETYTAALPRACCHPPRHVRVARGTRVGSDRRPARSHHEALSRGRGGRRPLARHRARRVLLDARALRLRQDHHAAHDRRLRGARPRARSSSAGAMSPGCRPYKRDVEHGLPELRALPAPDRLRERGLRPPAQAVDRTEIGSRVGEMLDLVHLPGYGAPARASFRAASSSAWRWRARSSTSRGVLLLDEPLGALDLKLREQMQIELKRIQREVGITFDLRDPRPGRGADHVRPDRGHERAAGSSSWARREELYERPTTAFVAGFLGVSNLLDGEVAGRDGSLVTVRLPDGTALQRAGRRHRALRPGTSGRATGEAEGRCRRPGRRHRRAQRAIRHDP